jgi:hypothetical protein
MGRDKRMNPAETADTRTIQMGASEHDEWLISVGERQEGERIREIARQALRPATFDKLAFAAGWKEGG